MSAHIHTIGIAVPTPRLDQQDALAHATARCSSDRRQERLLSTTYRRSGVDQRHVLIADRAWDDLFAVPVTATDFGPTTSDRMHAYAAHADGLAFDACQRALRDSPISAHEVTHLVTVSCTGFSAPGADIDLVDRLGLARTVARTNVGFMGCHGALNGLRVASAFARSDDCARVLMCCVELCSIHFAYGWQSDRIIANALFADGAGAAIVHQGGEANRWTLTAQSSWVVPDTRSLMSWTIGDHGFEMTLSSMVPDMIASTLPAFLETWLQEHGLTLDAIAGWAVHPGGPRILDAVEDCLQLPANALATSRDVLRQFGNVSSVTLLLILEQLPVTPADGPVVMLAFGPGLTVEAALLT
ncbi:MAG: type III polyketide synthase [Planctomycetota bacterium]